MTRYITEHCRVGDFQPEGTEASDGWSRADHATARSLLCGCGILQGMTSMTSRTPGTSMVYVCLLSPSASPSLIAVELSKH